MSVTPRPYTEDAAVEKPAIELFGELGWEHVNAYHEKLGAEETLGRESRNEVFLLERLRRALERLNPGAPSDAVDQTIAEITKERGALHYVRANRRSMSCSATASRSPFASPTAAETLNA